jgi:hypothetical protein
MPRKNYPRALLRRFSQCPEEPYSGSTKTARSDEHPESTYKKTVYLELYLGGGFTCEFLIWGDGTLKHTLKPREPYITSTNPRSASFCTTSTFFATRACKTKVPACSRLHDLVGLVLEYDRP